MQKNVSDLKEAQFKLSIDGGDLKTPAERRAELKDIKTKLSEFNAMKT